MTKSTSRSEFRIEICYQDCHVKLDCSFNLNFSANFDQYSLSSEEPSSYDSSSVRSDSAPSTPKAPRNTAESEEGNEQQWAPSNNKSECSKELWSDCQEETKESNSDEFLGCELLTENCVKAYS
jgi:hypothetical protein